MGTGLFERVVSKTDAIGQPATQVALLRMAWSLDDLAEQIHEGAGYLAEKWRHFVDAAGDVAKRDALGSYPATPSRFSSNREVEDSIAKFDALRPVFYDLFLQGTGKRFHDAKAEVLAAESAAVEGVPS